MQTLFLLVASAIIAVADSQVGEPAINVKGPFIQSVAPRENIFAGISAQEIQSIYEFLGRQIQVTIPGDVQFSRDRGYWLLPPNKTEATSYLDGKGPKPARYARVMGSAKCFDREYMVGPLPVGSSTKATPLLYVNHGNATLDIESCSNEVPRRTGARDIQRRQPYVPYEEPMMWNRKQLPHDEKAPPTISLPNGARHEFDPKQNYVSWMDFTFFISTGPAGVSLHDIRFKGERVVYELAMQEALAQYAGPDKEQTYASYMDVTSGFTEFNLIPGYDCPSYATYTNAFCLFEYPKDYPMNRHQDRSRGYQHATKNIAFLVRSISTAGNYDYQTTYEFYYDGSIQILMRASGYIQGSDNVDAANAHEYGFRIRDGLFGSMHDHVLNFKADLDILGTQNTLLKTEFVPHSQVYDWSDGKVVNTMKVERAFITNEDQGKINWAPNSAAAYAVVNRDSPNEFGEYPGFRIYPSTGSATHLTVQNSTVFGRLVDWASHNLYVLRRKDTEPVSTHPMAHPKEKRSLVNFASFFNGESLDQQDIVLYFNLGMHHMPDTSDLPTTVFQGAQSGITLRPQNYQRSDNSMSTRQQIKIINSAGREVIETYGTR